MNQNDNVGAHETNLDFIRAVAVLIVVGSHLALFFGNLHIGFLEPSLFGKLGVVIFFVHSGIVNMFSIERHVQKHGEYRLFRAFMIRRCFSHLSLVDICCLSNLFYQVTREPYC